MAMAVPRLSSANKPCRKARPSKCTAVDGQSGEPRWFWHGGETLDSPGTSPLLCLAAFDGISRREPCVNFGSSQGRRRVAILDAKGRERAGRELKPGSLPLLMNVDLDGDGRDELLFHDGDSLRACHGDFKEQWSRPTRETIREIIPASTGRPATVVLNPSLGLDGATGRPLWSIGPAGSIPRATDGNSMPRGLTGPDGTTVCRAAMPFSANGAYRPTEGVPARRASLRDDPRWERPLPWVRPVEPYADPLVQVAVAATLINVCIPVADSLVGHPTDDSGACGCCWPFRSWPPMLLSGYSGHELADARSSPNVRASLVGRVPRCRPACDRRFTDRGLRDRVGFVAGPRAVAEAAARPPDRGRDSCGRVFGPLHRDSRKGPADIVVVVVDSPRYHSIVDQRFADRGLRGRVSLVRWPAGSGLEWEFSLRAPCSRPS